MKSRNLCRSIPKIYLDKLNHNYDIKNIILLQLGTITAIIHRICDGQASLITGAR